jgi:hypothetical protein
MKIVILILIIINSSFSKKIKQVGVPTGSHLANHFGKQVTSTPIDALGIYNRYVQPQLYSNSEGPSRIRDSLKQYQQKGNGFNSAGYYGSLYNIAPEATGLKNPNIAGPKLHIAGEAHYPVEAMISTVKGVADQFHHVNVLDKENNRIFDEHVVIKNQPIIEKKRGVIFNKSR